MGGIFVGLRQSLIALLTGSVFVAGGLPASSAATTGPCTAPTNAIVCENSKAGSPESDWRVDQATGNIMGYGTATSVLPGGTMPFKVNTPSTRYHIEIYRLGWYGGNGARLISTVSPSVRLPQTQPTCLYDGSSGMTDCGNWAVSATWSVPTDAVSGYYVADFVRDDANGESQFPFIVRNDSSTSDILVQASDETWQAYNSYGGNNFYGGNFTSANGRAYKDSYNRPYDNSGTANFMNAELPMLRWLERNGYDVSYVSGTDIARDPSLPLKHKVFISSGHDEYWAGVQRTNVEKALAAGVNLAFFSGNEMYWKTRFESSYSSDRTAYRTLVCYKDTQDATRLDPNTSDWTGAWADPTYSPPADGGRPQNALTGTEYKVNGYANDSITVGSQYSALRFWRNTSVATLPAGQKATFFQGSLGYEWDTDADNGVRPAGAIDMSQTTVTHNDGQVLLDYGRNYGNGTVTHSLVLYRASSGALVFGAGTVQWAWGLDNDHLYPGPATDVRMQQATVNLFADMGAQPLTLQSGLVRATKSTDTTGPSVTIKTPAANSTVPALSIQTVTGTATDVGGVVARVEVSTDGGKTFEPATPTGANGSWSSWSFAWTPTAPGSAALSVRAVDDSVNIGPVSSETLSVGAQSCPCTLFGALTPAEADAQDSATVELGTRFTPASAGQVTAIRFYKSVDNTGTHTGSLWTSSGQLLATGTFTNETASGWQTLTLASPVVVTAGATYVVSYKTTTGHYAADAGYFTGKGAGLPPLTAPASTSSAPNGVYAYGGGFPTGSFGDTNYWVDVVYSAAAGSQDTTPPSVTGTNPAAGATGTNVGAATSATFSEPVSSAGLQFTVTGPGGAALAGTTTVSPDGLTGTFTPSSTMSPTTTYTASVRATDLSGNTMTAPYTWSFTTGTSSGTGAGTATVFGSAVPNVVDAGDGNAVELGTRVVPTVDAHITGVRFYKSAANTGTHTGSLWSATGKLLATGTFSGETATGWQTLTFTTPVQVSAGTTYVVSYHTASGHYSADSGYFTGKGAGAAPITAPASTSTAGNGLFVYGSGGFPTATYNDTNYWVDAVVDTTLPITPPKDTTPPTVKANSPETGAVDVGLSSPVRATMSEPVSATGLKVTLTASGGLTVPGTASVSSDGLTVTFTPSAQMASSTTYTASVTATDLAGNAMTSPYTWSFTTGTTLGAGAGTVTVFGSATPTVIDANDGSAVELGTRIVPSVDGKVTGVRFYKSAANTGTHTGTLWSAGGQVLATGTFSNESASGWQTLTFASPVQVHSGTTYVVSYHTTTGHYSADSGYFTGKAGGASPLTAPASTATAGNGVFAYGTGGFPTGTYNDTNYWVDAVLDSTVPAPDTTPPGVTAVAPATGATGVATTVSVTATFSEPVTTAGLQLGLTGPGGVAVPGATTLSADGRTATFTPTAALTVSTGYTASVRATDLAGNAMTSAYTWSFTTAATGDTTPPSVTATSPAAGATGAAPGGAVSATFSEAVVGTGLQFSVVGPDGTAVPGTAGVSADGLTATFTPSAALTVSTAYTASVRATDRSGNVMPSPTSWSFTVAPAACPCTVFGTAVPNTVDTGDGSSLELGMRFVPAVNQVVTGVRFYKSAANTGTHTGSLWSATGQLLATGTFTNETASGWQTLTFASGVQVRAGTTYVVSYQTPSGHYSADAGYFTGRATSTGVLTAPASTATAGNGLFAVGSGFPTSSFNDTNYYVDVVTTTAGVDTTPPSIAVRQPAAGATGVPINQAVSVTFSEPISPTGMSMSVAPAGGAAVVATTAVSSDGRTVTLTPSNDLAASTAYTVTVSAADLMGNAMSPQTWSFTTGTTATLACPCSLFRSTDAPAQASFDAQPLSLGMTWSPMVDGTVTAIRFYKVSGDTGTHTGTLFSSGGDVLATGTFANETSSGWQTLVLSAPVSVTAGTSYVVAYSSPQGWYGVTAGYFSSARTVSPLTAPANSPDAVNGRFAYGAGSLFPASSGNGSNYYVDVVFSPS